MGKWDNARLAHGTVTEEIGRLKQQSGKDMVIFGGAELAQSGMELGLIDEYRFFVTATVLGEGKPLFKSSKDRFNLKLSNTKPFESGCVLLTYVPQD